MKIKVKKMDYDQVVSLPSVPRKRAKPAKFPMQLLMRLVSIPELLAVRFQAKKINMERLSKKEACLILMNHSSFLDLKIASKLLFPRKYNIVTTSDGLVGKSEFMRSIGCIPTPKFVTDIALVKDLLYLTKKENTSVLMFPEASYSFDGTATTLPESLAKMIKLLGVPIVMIRTFGAFARDPLYNSLQVRKTKVTAEMEYLLSPEDIQSMAVTEIQSIIEKQFAFDYFRWQQENLVRIDEDFRADGLHRVLYKCPHCMSETSMEGKNTILTCKTCGVIYELDEFGYLINKTGESLFNHIPDWYQWQRTCIEKSIQEDTYALDIEVDIYLLTNLDCIYQVGSGRLRHDANGFLLEGCNGRLIYNQKPQSSYSLYSDFFWYEIGDMICIGNQKTLYYCFPQNGENIAAKTRMATEILYKKNCFQQVENKL